MRTCIFLKAKSNILKVKGAAWLYRSSGDIRYSRKIGFTSCENTTARRSIVISQLKVFFFLLIDLFFANN